MPSIYQEQIIDYYKYPRNKRKMEDPSFDYGDQNPVCGDEIHFYVKFDDDGKVVDASFDGVGCAISQASVSMLTDLIEGMTLDELKQLTNEDIEEMLGIPLSPVRLKCAILGLKVLEGGIIKFEGGPVGSSVD
ncbi:MAG: NifU-like protein [Candidatus Heimdallarchaeota archaeon LC_2]|nr:MAG: NifU-like protein [Candidatus Heimdallarchaeota archaeon LC_2]